MKWTIKLVVEVIPGSPVEHEVGSIERAEEVSPATVGLTIAEGKALLGSLQSQIVTEQIQRHAASFKACPECGQCRAALKSRISRLYFSMIFHTLTAVS
jgi:hypothetical protein